jgi:two-component system chemotaxis response regulator CheY
VTIQRSKHQDSRRYKHPEPDLKLTPPEGIGFEILIVDDDPNILTALSFSLADSSHHITTALGGREALDVLYQKVFDVIITDLNMPAVDGISVLRKAKAMHSNTKVIIMTGSVISDPIRRIIFGEANGFLSKPFGLTELYETVASCLGTKTFEPGCCNEPPSRFPAEALPP